MEKFGKIIRRVSLLLEEKNYEHVAKFADDKFLNEDAPATLFFQIGIALSQLKRDNESLKFYSNALKKNPDFWQARHNRGTLLLQGG